MVSPESMAQSQGAAVGDFPVRFFPGLIFHGLLGVGGMGSVYLVEHPVLRRRVALKVLRPDRSEAQGFSERFAREARLLAALQHPNVLTLLEFGTATDPQQLTRLHWHTTEYIDGQNLRSLLGAGPVAPSQVNDIMQQIFAGLQHAHAQGIVHRDLKPDNLLQDRTGVVKIADFGLARSMNPENASLYFTQTRQVTGTPQYMAPEQLTGKSETDVRTDVYSLAVLCYELLTGELPLGRFALPSEKAPISAQIDNVLLKAMASNPADRFQSISEFSLAWTAAIEGQAFFHRPPGAGFSTVIDRTVHLAWQRLSGKRQPTVAKPQEVPAILQSVIAAAGAGGLILLARLHQGFLTTHVHQLVFCALTIVLFSLTAVSSLLSLRWARFNVTNRFVLLVVSLILLVLSFVSLLTSSSGDWTVSLGIPTIIASLLLALNIRSLVFTLRNQRAVCTSSAATLSIRCPETHASEQGLPRFCATCGAPGEGVIEKQLQYYWKADYRRMLVGAICGVIPGLIVAATAQQVLKVRLPLCREHMDDRRLLLTLASSAWLLIPALAITGGCLSAMLCFGLLHSPSALPVIFSAFASGLVGVGYYIGLILPPWQPVTEISRTEEGSPPVGVVLLDRVHRKFADALRADLAAAGVVSPKIASQASETRVSGTPNSGRQPRS
ncbi:MAG: serine/threonine protein kinase [Planctomycetaceae bacterium]